MLNQNFEYNKKKILTALKNASVGTLTLHYCGEDNSGHFEDIKFTDLEGKKLKGAPLKAQETRVLYLASQDTRPKIKFLGMAVSDLIYDFVLDELNPGWAYGSEGFVKFDALRSVIQYNHKGKPQNHRATL